MVDPPRWTFLGDLSAEEREQLLAQWPRRRFSAGTTIIEQGRPGAGLLVILAGSAEVLATGPSGELRQLAIVGEGDLLGELGLFSGQPASSTVRAVTDVEALALDDEAVLGAAAELPWLYPRLGRVVTERLLSTQRQLLAVAAGRLLVLRDEGGPPQLPVALGASVAWHTGAPVLALLAGPDIAEGPGELPPVAHPDELASVAAALGAEPACGAVRLPAWCQPTEVEAAARRAAEPVPTVLVRLPAAMAVPLAGDAEVRIRRSGTDGATAVSWSGGPERDHMVRALRGPEMSHVAGGRIGLSGPLGRDLGRAARGLTRHRVGLALGSGSARGFAHVGVLRSLAAAGIPVDAIAGTSIGAAVAALHALGQSPDEVFETLVRAGRLAVRPLGLGRSLLSIAGLRGLIERTAGGRRLEELATPLAVVAADVDTGAEVVFRRGQLAPAVLASLAVPGVYPPQHVAGRRLIDGAFVDPVPVRVTASLGADTVIAVRLAARPPVGDVELESTVTRGDGLWAPQVILRSVDVMSGAIAATAGIAADVLIEPSFHGLGGGLRDFRRGAEYARIGEEAAARVLPTLARTLPWLRA